MEKKRTTKPKTEISSSQMKIAIDAVKDLIKDSTLVKQRRNLDLVLKTLYYATEDERKLSQKYQRLRSEILANSSKIKAAIQLSEEDKGTINTLKNELEKAWKIIGVLRSQHQMVPKNSKETTFSLSSRLCLSPKETLMSEYSMNKQLKEDILHLKKEEKSWREENQSLKLKLDKELQESSQLRDKNSKMLQEIKNMVDLSNMHEALTKQYESKLKVIEKMELDMASIRIENNNLTLENEKLKLQIFELEEELASKEKKAEEYKAEITKTNNNKLVYGEEKFLNDNSEGLKKPSMALVKTLIADKAKQKLEKMEFQMKKFIRFDTINKGRIKQLKEELHTVINSINSTENEKSLLAKELSEAMRQNEALKTENEELKSDHGKSTTSLKHLENIRDNYCHEIGKLEEKILHLKNQLAKWERCKYATQIADLKKELSIISDKWEKENKNSKELRESLMRIQNEVVELEEIVKEYERLLQELQDEMADKWSKQGFGNANHISSSQLSNKCLKHYSTIIQNLKEKFLVLIESVKNLTIEKDELRDKLEQEKRIWKDYSNQMIENKQYESKMEEEISGHIDYEEFSDTDIESANDNYINESSIIEKDKVNAYCLNSETKRVKEIGQGDRRDGKELSGIEKTCSGHSMWSLSDSERKMVRRSDTCIGIEDINPKHTGLVHNGTEFSMKRCSSMESCESKFFKGRLRSINKNSVLPSKNFYLENENNQRNPEKLNSCQDFRGHTGELKFKKGELNVNIPPQFDIDNFHENFTKFDDKY